MIKDMPNKFSEVTPEIKELAKKCEHKIDEELFAKYNVNRGLRKRNGEGVLAGLTDISMIQSYTMIDREVVPCEGKLFYRGINIEDIVEGFISENRYGFEETCYLLLFGELPNQKQLDDFKAMIADYRQLPTNFVRDIIMKAPSRDMMNMLARSVLTLYAYDDNGSDTSIPNVLRQSIQLISLFPVLAVYGYQSYAHYEMGQSLFIHPPKEELSVAENILHLLRPDSKYSKLEAKLLDMALVLHAEHGGGNNSTFTTHVVSSSGTDTYSAIAAALCSLKGPKHGGANIKVVEMFADLKEHVKDWKDEDEIRAYLLKLLNKEAFDHAGLIYGMGHAVYSISDPRSKILSRFVRRLSEEKGREDEYHLYTSVEKLAKEVIAKERKIYKGVSANIDFYSGFIYSMLGLPHELYTPLFAIARIAGWCAHRMEELVNGNRIIRPAYKAVAPTREYVPLKDRK
ncbi:MULTISPECIES: citrate/2-methylcitrate synthase [Anaerostipes]|uniref:Citrate synthase n=1 Tax=Anaerostipes butyraticus TaxID=645466 RepID=A0A916Q7R9_9FIRM|nr:MULTISPECIES: citrate/2-methylcitrate synthase [Anaerostipes]GFO85978.1 citrate synthase [Anaerostipes butyraticus]HJC82045.1 citrate/2-methylcitrate synthase [Candidatus Anaerostipes avicola]